MNDRDTVRQRPAANRPAANRPGANRPGAGPALLTKAEKRAAAKAARAKAAAAAKRRQVLTVVGAAVAVIAVIAVVVVLALRSDEPASTQSSAGASSSAAETTAAATTPAAFPPLPPDADPALSTKPVAKAGSGTLSKLTVTTLIEGKGAATQKGQTIAVNYVGVTFADGKEFDSSWSRSQPLTFPIGNGGVIQGWDQGLLGVKVGSRVQLDIPSDLAYGDNPDGGRPGGALRFIVDVLSVS